MLGIQVADETEEQRKKRLLDQQRASGTNRLSGGLGDMMTRASSMSSVFGGAY